MAKSQLSVDNYYELNAPELIAGIDEVGRGSLFGAVVCAAVVLPIDQYIPLITAGVKDSKKLTAKKRRELFALITTVAESYHIALATVSEIEKLNIRGATLLAMARAVQGLGVQPSLCLVDGRDRIPTIDLPQVTLIQGDDRSVSIAAASILAKVYRDDLISQFASQYPVYGLDRHMGYGTAQHRLAIQTHGATPEHRRLFLRKIQQNQHTVGN
jgi:ribonuclease HII